MNDPADEASAAAMIKTLSPKAAKMVAVEILLSDPESLLDDVLESCLYILRERLTQIINLLEARSAARTRTITDTTSRSQ